MWVIWWSNMWLWLLLCWWLISTHIQKARFFNFCINHTNNWLHWHNDEEEEWLQAAYEKTKKRVAREGGNPKGSIDIQMFATKNSPSFSFAIWTLRVQSYLAKSKASSIKVLLWWHRISENILIYHKSFIAILNILL